MLISGCVAVPDGPSPTDPHGFTITSVPSAPGGTLILEEALNAFRDCLGEHGVGIEPIGLDAHGRPRLAEALGRLDLTDRAVLDALESCGHHLTNGPLDLSSDPELRDLMQNYLLELAECLRLWGVQDFPDPIPGFQGVGAPFPSNEIPWTDPNLPTAVRQCRVATN
jgi:hypothetical protein